MLKRNINVFANVVMLFDHFQHFHREAIRIGVMQSDPFKSRNLASCSRSLRQHSFFVKIKAVVCCILGNNIDLLDSLCRQILQLPG